MAGDWMKVDLELPDKPEVFSIAGMINKEPEFVVGALIKVWAWFDKHTEDGNAYGVTLALPDKLTGVTGFGEAMLLVGWLEQKDKYLVMPKFDRHTSSSAKSRALTAKRVNKSRVKVKDSSNDECNASTVTNALPREEKRRDINTMSISSKSDYDSEPDFIKFWNAYPRKDDKKKSFIAWKKQKPPIDLVLTSLEWQKKSTQWTKDNGQFVPLGETYINGARWEAEKPKENNSGSQRKLPEGWKAAWFE